MLRGTRRMWRGTPADVAGRKTCARYQAACPCGWTRQTTTHLPVNGDRMRHDLLSAVPCMPDGSASLTLTLHGTIAEIAASDWDACAGDDNPFVSHAFLSALEESGSADE